MICLCGFFFVEFDFYFCSRCHELEPQQPKTLNVTSAKNKGKMPLSALDRYLDQNLREKKKTKELPRYPPPKSSRARQGDYPSPVLCALTSPAYFPAILATHKGYRFEGSYGKKKGIQKNESKPINQALIISPTKLATSATFPTGTILPRSTALHPKTMRPFCTATNKYRGMRIGVDQRGTYKVVASAADRLSGARVVHRSQEGKRRAVG